MIGNVCGVSGGRIEVIAEIVVVGDWLVKRRREVIGRIKIHFGILVEMMTALTAPTK